MLLVIKNCGRIAKKGIMTNETDTLVAEAGEYEISMMWCNTTSAQYYIFVVVVIFL